MKTCNFTPNFAFSCFRRDKGYLRVSEIFVRISRLLAVLLSRRSMFASLLFYGRLLLFLFTGCQLRVASFHIVGRPTICLTWISGLLRICYHACDMFVYKSKEKEENPPVNTERFVCCLGSSTWKKYDWNEVHSVVVMINCSIHVDAWARQLIERAGGGIFNSTSYSSESITIEYVSHQWKAYLARWHRVYTADWFEVTQVTHSV